MEPELQVMAADVSNAFLYGKNIERTMIKVGPEFGDLQGNYLIVDGGCTHKTSGRDLASKISEPHFVWRRSPLTVQARRGRVGINLGILGDGLEYDVLHEYCRTMTGNGNL
jgi:hypothetical protein